MLKCVIIDQSTPILRNQMAFHPFWLHLSVNSQNNSDGRIFKLDENKDEKYKKPIHDQEVSNNIKSNQQNLQYVPGHIYKICDTQTFGTHYKKSLPLWEAEMICASEFVSICMNHIPRKNEVNQNNHESIQGYI